MTSAVSPSELSLQALTAYLHDAGWSLLDTDERTTLWAPLREAMAGDPDAGSVRIVLPTQEQVSDYQERVQQALSALSFVERRLTREIVEDISLGGADWVSVRLTPNAPSGEAPLGLAHSAITALRNYVVGSASSLALDGATLVLPSRRPVRAEMYARDARLSTASGSFVLNLALPLRDAEERDRERERSKAEEADPSKLDVPVVDFPPLPYGRQVAKRMATVALRSTQLARQVGEGDASLEMFGRPGRQTGNATELAALAAMGAAESDRRKYHLRFGYSPLISSGREVPENAIAVTPAEQRVLEDASDFLRTKQPRAGVLVSGLVVRLARAGKLGPGDIVVEGIDDDSGARRRFSMTVAEDDYNGAIRAHEQGLQVIVRGDIQMRGTQRHLHNLSSFDVITPMGED